MDPHKKALGSLLYLLLNVSVENRPRGDCLRLSFCSEFSHGMDCPSRVRRPPLEGICYNNHTRVKEIFHQACRVRLFRSQTWLVSDQDVLGSGCCLPSPC